MNDEIDCMEQHASALHIFGDERCQKGRPGKVILFAWFNL